MSRDNNKNVIPLAIFWFLCLQTFSQVTIDQNDMPKEGDTLRMSVTNVILTDYTKTGFDTTWNFSALMKTGQQIDTFVNVLNVPPVYWLTFTPVLVSNLAAKGNNPFPLPGVLLTDYYTFYKNSATSFSNLGFAFQISGLPIMVKYDNPDIWYTFPCIPGSAWNSQSASSATLPGLGYYSTSRDRTSVVDGWGNLITPYGTFQTIRIKSQWVENDSIYLDSLGLGFPIVRSVTEYKWVGKNQGEPLLQITEEGLIKTATYRDIINHAGFSEISKESVKVYPNPTKGSFCVWLNCPDQPARLVLLNTQGKKIKEKDVRFTSGKTGLIDLTDIPVGFYILQVIHDKEIFTGKLFLERE